MEYFLKKPCEYSNKFFCCLYYEKIRTAVVDESNASIREHFIALDILEIHTTYKHKYTEYTHTMEHFQHSMAFSYPQILSF